VLVCASCGAENREGARFCDACGSSLEAALPSREQRKTVTVVFCDLTGSTQLGESTDPEALRALLARYFERMKAIIEAHGGSVEKFIGDAVMAVFGVPVAHEDDALRACRAAVEMRAALPELGIAGRIGVNTGEVVAGTEERLATGDAVNVAARLEQAARPGEVLVGGETLRLVRPAVEVGEERLLDLKGKSEPVAAYPLVAVTGGLERRFATPMVGRGNELGRLQNVFAQAVHDRSCQLFTVLGSAGVGKSRLAAEFLSGVEAGVVRGRCLSYGEGITYWPVVEILKQLATLPGGDAALPLRSLLGETDQLASAEEIAWGFRKLLEQEAQEGPLVVVFDDLHWGEETLLDLVEHVADLSRDAPILLLGMARPELLERRPSWGGGKWNATTVLLEPLDAAETEQLLSELGKVPDELHARIVQVAEGNPLFVEEMLALVRDSGGVRVEVPPTIQALLAARLDQLDPAERSVLERGSIEGRTFHRGAVAALANGDGSIDQRLVALVRKQLVRPDRAQLAGDDAYRFRHLLIRDAAYDALPKATRGDLHRRFAAWLEQHGQELVELDEILGYHLEQACAYRRELDLPTDEQLTARARLRLAAAGRRALLREDQSAAAKLLERAAALGVDSVPDIGLEVDLAQALFNAGRIDEALRRSGDAAARAAAAGDDTGELCCQIQEALVRIFAAPEGATERLEALATRAILPFEAAEDELGLFLAHFALGEVAHMRLKGDAALAAFEQALTYARQLGSPHREQHLLAWIAAARFGGSTPVADLLAWFDAHRADGIPNFPTVAFRSIALAMTGEVADARALMSAGISALAERGSTLIMAEQLALAAVELELIAGDPTKAVEYGLEGCRRLEELGERAWLSTAAAELAEALYQLDRLDEAQYWAERSAELGASDDVATQTLWRQVKGKLLARRGDLEAGEQLVREAVALAEPTDHLDFQGGAYRDLAEVLQIRGNTDEVRGALEQALTRYQRKGNLLMAERMHAQLSLCEASGGRQE
jgi:class 3 adenylate cyclase/tetratricopeptide (TPR) repeat protein